MKRTPALSLTIAQVLSVAVALPCVAQQALAPRLLAASDPSSMTAMARASTMRSAPTSVWSSPAFSVGLDPHGLITSLSNPADPLKMDWVRQAGPAWGLPMTREQGKLVTWDAPTVASSSDHAEELHFTHGPYTLVLKQELSGGKLTQTYTLKNNSAAPISLAEGDFGIRVPLPDNYPDATTALTRRSNVHVWTGGNTSWIEAVRMNGQGPHLGLVLDQGTLTGYSITDRPWDSNDRGVFVVHPAAMVLAPGKSTTLAWSIFWNKGWDDFFAQAMTTPGFVRLQAGAYTVFPHQPLQITADAASSLSGATVTINGTPVKAKIAGNHLDVSYTPTTPGDQQVELTLGNRHTTLRAFAASEPIDLIQARVRFLIQNQQRNAPGQPDDGAFLPYDNETRQIIVQRMNDYNSGRERVGMGLLLALYLPRCTDPQLRQQIVASLDRFWNFVHLHLQNNDGVVFNDTDDPTERLYNYPWVARLHMVMYQNTKDQRYLDEYMKTIRSFYAQNGQRFYPIGLPIAESLVTLTQAGRTADHDEALALFRGHADRILTTGMAMPKSEVNYEQSIVGPASGILLELYLATHEQKYLEGATPFLTALYAFNGQQPDHHLNDVAIRHWDDYWFGKTRMYGDTFPQYWSTITAVVLDDAAQAEPIQAASFRARAQKIVANNLSYFGPDGSAHCAYVYPLSVDDRPGRLYDAWANDQDWALVHYLMINPLAAK